ncbi:hypothetical protein FOZ63_023382, partial [Perkinsus olseni]
MPARAICSHRDNFRGKLRFSTRVTLDKHLGAQVGVMTGRSIASSSSEVSSIGGGHEIAKDVVNSHMWLYYSKESSYWYISPGIGHALAYARCAGRPTPAQADPCLTGGDHCPWEVFDKFI